MATPYKNIAKAALMSWPPFLSEEEANKKIENETVEQLEGQVYAIDSVKNAVIGIAKYAKLNREEGKTFFLSIVNGPENHEIFNIVKEKTAHFKNEDVLNVLAEIHDGWVVDNSSEKNFSKKVSRNQLRQYAPLELIGWNEVVSDLLFLRPIMESVGIVIDDKSLKETYHSRVKTYMEKNNITGKDELIQLIKRGKGYYSILPSELEEKLLPMSSTVVEQLIDNWQKKDTETFELFSSHKKKEEINMKI